MTTFGCKNIGSSFTSLYETRSKTAASSSKAAASDRDGMTLRGGRVLKKGTVDQKKSKKVKRAAPAKRTVAAAKALQHRKRLIAVQQKQNENADERAELERRARVRFNHVWVGNLVPGYTQRDIAQVFSKACGEVLSVSLRITVGKGITIGTRIPDAVRAREDTTYAQVVFAHPWSAKKAIDSLNGMKLHGIPLVVTRNVSELPEFRTIVDRAFPPRAPSPTPSTTTTQDGEENEEAQEASGLARTPSFAPCAIPLEPTELLDGPPSTNFRLFGISFQADIC